MVVDAAQINIIMLISEFFKEFYTPTHHSESAYYLFFGLNKKNALNPLIWTSIPLNILATITLTFHKLRNNLTVLYICCFILFVAICIEKGFGLIVPGFIPGPYSKIVEYLPSGIEVTLGTFFSTILARTAISIETGKLRFQKE